MPPSRYMAPRTDSKRSHNIDFSLSASGQFLPLAETDIIPVAQTLRYLREGKFTYQARPEFCESALLVLFLF